MKSNNYFKKTIITVAPAASVLSLLLIFCSCTNKTTAKVKKNDEIKYAKAREDLQKFLKKYNAIELSEIDQNGKRFTYQLEELVRKSKPVTFLTGRPSDITKSGSDYIVIYKVNDIVGRIMGGFLRNVTLRCKQAVVSNIEQALETDNSSAQLTLLARLDRFAGITTTPNKDRDSGHAEIRIMMYEGVCMQVVSE